MSDPRWVLLDTDVWSVLFSRRNTANEDATAWQEILLGASLAVATQTRAEVLIGLRLTQFGARRADPIRAQLDRTTTVPITSSVVDSYIELTARCRELGHALHDKPHTADRWIAATAVANGMPLASRDRIFRDVPGLNVLRA